MAFSQEKTKCNRSNSGILNDMRYLRMHLGQKESPIGIEAFLLRNGRTGVERHLEGLIRTICQSPGQTWGPIIIYLWGDCSIQFDIVNPNIRIVRFPFRIKIARTLFLHIIFPFCARKCRFVLGASGFLVGTPNILGMLCNAMIFMGLVLLRPS
jgi:hypothetical protein